MSRVVLLASVARVPLPSPPRVLALWREQSGRLVHVCDVEAPEVGPITFTGPEPSAIYRIMPASWGTER